jgi:hypothetical protein
MKVNSIGSVTPVRKAVRAREASMPPTAFFRSGRAAWYMARQAAGRPNIITGKKPLMKAPAVGSPAKKRFRSPCAPLKSPTMNQATLFRMWCRPVMINSRFSRP